MATKRIGETQEEFLERHRLYLLSRRRAQGITQRRIGPDIEKRRAYVRAYQRQHPELPWAQKQRRRARKAGNIVEPVSRKGIVARDRGVCHLCLTPVSGEHFDHLIPVVRGGAYAEWNLMLAHEICNKRRGTKRILPEETRQAAEAYIAERTAKEDSINSVPEAPR